MDEKREKVAELAHSQWSGWMEYLFSKCRESRPSDGKAFHEECLIIPEWAVKRWKKQKTTPYCDLSEKEKDSDRAEADKFLKVMESHQSDTELVKALLKYIEVMKSKLISSIGLQNAMVTIEMMENTIPK